MTNEDIAKQLMTNCEIASEGGMPIGTSYDAEFALAEKLGLLAKAYVVTDLGRQCAFEGIPDGVIEKYRELTGLK